MHGSNMENYSTTEDHIGATELHAGVIDFGGHTQ